MEDNNIIKTSYSEDIKVKDLKLDNSDYIVFCYDKKDFYHMVPIIDKVIYDKNTDCMDLYAITIYKKIYKYNNNFCIKKLLKVLKITTYDSGKKIIVMLWKIIPAFFNQ